ncbi:hypothetical protein LCGC14_1061620 [marine sediment metagenome]|uniref:Squalene cyclase C-terminal domain-containing protein n=1 Tax=marine sediment metagenome TaxID=412755 RepID=A0A0F9Q3X3_9ZZZZ|nr:MAG: hypothetical protein Lokiarch_32720 [Candidatus Lokiarchaeum sp. GC14_75]
MQRKIHNLAHKILELNPDPIPKYLLLRDILKKDLRQLTDLKKQVLQTKWVREILVEQRKNGTWGRFHTENTKVKQKYPTTERALHRCAVIGLAKDDPPIKSAIDYMERVLMGDFVWEDWREKSEAWDAGVAVITASTLAEWCPNHPLVLPIRTLWQHIVEESFKNSQYKPSLEVAAQRKYHQISSDFYYIGSQYAIRLLSSGKNEKGPKSLLSIEEDYVKWLWTRESGMGYITNNRLADLPVEVTYRALKAKIKALDLLSGFPCTFSVCQDFIQWLWKNREVDGLWNFGPKGAEKIELPLSENPRKIVNRKIDYTVMILSILHKVIKNQL